MCHLRTAWACVASEGCARVTSGQRASDRCIGCCCRSALRSTPRRCICSYLVLVATSMLEEERQGRYGVHSYVPGSSPGHRGYRAWIGAVPREVLWAHQRKAKCSHYVFTLSATVFPVRRFSAFVCLECEMGVQGKYVSSQVNAPLLRTWRWDSTWPANEVTLGCKRTHARMRGAVCASKVPRKHKDI